MVACCVGLTAPKNVSAQGSPYVPIMDASYSYLDGLVAIGLVEVPSLIQRPYSRLTFSKFIKQARRNLDTLPQTRERFREALAKLEREFASEIGLLNGDSVSLRNISDPAVVMREIRGDFTVARSPERLIRTAYSDNSFIDGVLNLPF